MENVIVLVVLLLVLNVDATPKNVGSIEVCSRMEQKKQTRLVEIIKQVVENIIVGCWDYTQNFKCKRKIYVPKKFNVIRTALVYQPVYFCCPGYEEKDAVCVKEVPRNLWTISTEGCPCYFNVFQSCACCVYGGCQCGYHFPDRCVQCGYGHMCTSAYDLENTMGVDAWTHSESGCACDGSDGPGECPCCQHRGVQCREGNTKRCSQAGLPQSCYFK